MSRARSISARSSRAFLPAATALPAAQAAIGGRVVAHKHKLWATTIQRSWWLFAVGGTIAVAFEIDAAAGPWLWVAAVFLGGLAHGAGDALDAPRSPAHRVAWWAAYGVGIALLWLAAAAAPVLSLAVFVVLTCWHFGAADARSLRELSFTSSAPVTTLPSTLMSWLSGSGRLAIVFGVMFAVHSHEILDVAKAMLPHIGSNPSSFASVAPISVERFGIVLAACGGFAWAVAALARQHSRLLAIDAAETTGLIVAALILDPLFAVGLYFLCWHAPRELARRADQLAARTTADTRHGAQGWSSVFRYHVSTAWLWLPIVPIWIGMGILVEPAAASQPLHWAAAFIALCVVLTPIHHLLEVRCDLPARER